MDAHTNAINTLETTPATKCDEIADLQSVLTHFSRVGSNVYITGANLHIRNTSGSTDGAPDGLGNLIVGYNEIEVRGGGNDDRSGSHNLVVGSRHNFSSYGGLVAGLENNISGAWASVSGGHFNTASGFSASVSGGVQNSASGIGASTSGGLNRSAVGQWDWVAGTLFENL